MGANYVGPGWYWVENHEAPVFLGLAEKGEVCVHDAQALRWFNHIRGQKIKIWKDRNNPAVLLAEVHMQLAQLAGGEAGMNKDNNIQYLQDWVQHYEMVLALLDEKQDNHEREPAEAYWCGGCP